MKHKRGKSKKETWKKLTACDDVDQFLVDQRDDEIRGTSNNDDSFFFFDTKKAEFVPSAGDDDAAVVGPVDVRKLRCFAGIYRNPSAVKDPVIKRNAIKTKEKRVKVNELPPKKSTTVAAPYDLWSSAAAPTPTTNRHRRKKTLSYKPSLVPAIEVPSGGLSVNPSFLDHQALLRSALNDETLAKKNPPVKKIFAPETKLEEIKSEDESDETITTVRKQPVAKTRAARRRQAEEKVKEENRKREKSRRQLENDVFKIKGMKKKIEAHEKKIKERYVSRMKKLEEKNKFGVKELSKFKFIDSKDEVTLRGDLGGRLTNIKAPIKDLLTDRFKSLQKRNVIEVRLKNSQKKKHRGKKYVRRSDKMEWEKTGEWNGVKVGDALSGDTQKKHRNKHNN